MRRKASVSSPNLTFDLANEWDEFTQNTVDNIGVFNTTLSVDNIDNTLFKLYPNPVTDFAVIQVNDILKQDLQVKLVDVNGKVFSEQTFVQNKPMRTKYSVFTKTTYT